MCVSALVKQLILYETWQFWGESNKSKHWFWFWFRRRHCVGDWCKERIFFCQQYSSMFENVSFGKWYFIFPYFTVCTVPQWHVITLQTYQLTIVWKLLAKCKKSFFAKRVYNVHKMFDVSSFNLRKSKWYPGMSS